MTLSGLDLIPCWINKSRLFPPFVACLATCMNSMERILQQYIISHVKIKSEMVFYDVKLSICSSHVPKNLRKIKIYIKITIHEHENMIECETKFKN